MNFAFQQLYQKLNVPRRLIIGLMSGTSADGLNVALCEFTPLHEFKVLHFENVSYTTAFRAKILNVRSQEWVNLEALCRLNVEIAEAHAEIVHHLLKKWQVQTADILAIASHGQTIFHAPAEDFNSTLQMGDADHLAVKTGCLVWSDFRQKHIAAGGEGAPLAIYADAAWFHSPTENRVLINLGGIANFTWIPSQDKSLAFATDTGPANTLIDVFCQHFFNSSFDADGALSAQGTLHQPLLDALLQHEFFSKKLPKSTGQEVFNEAYVSRILDQFPSLNPCDVLCTLTHFTAKSIAQALLQLPDENYVIYGSGGGMYNTFLKQCISNEIQKPLHDVGKLGMNADAKEAALFALLAHEAMYAEPFVMNQKKPFYMGKLSFPV